VSHVAKIDLKILNLDALKTAADSLGLEFVEGQTSYRWYGHHVGDYPMPEGMSLADLGTCDHAMRIPGNPSAYEIGVKKMADGSYTLLWDFWQGGYGLQDAIGKDGVKLKDGYALQAALNHYRRNGFRVSQSTENGKIVLRASR
jgi:hypothetical protein